jgi:hypothetical protein
LPVGPVEIVIRALPETEISTVDWWQYLQRARRQLEALNYPFMNEQEVTAWIDELRADDDRLEKAHSDP